jgi:microcompartment protein CcmK/EutM
MLLGRIVGNVVCTIKDPALEGKKILIVQPVGKDGKDRGRPVIALDAVGAGAGELVYWCRGREATYAWPEEVPTEATIVGIVDTVQISEAPKG